MDIHIGTFTQTVLLALLVSLLTFIAARYWFGRNVVQREAERLEDSRIKEAAHLTENRELAATNLARDHVTLVARVAEMEAKFAVLAQAVVPISTAFQAILIKELTHFHTPRMDELLGKVGPPSILTPSEEQELADALRAREIEVDDRISDAERDAAHILPIIIKRAKAEALTPDKPVLFKLVTVAQSEKERP